MLVPHFADKYASGMNAVVKSQAVLVSAHAGRLAISLAVASLLGRGLAPADFGFVMLVSTIYVVALEVLDMGTTAVATREIAAHPGIEREILTRLIALRRMTASGLLLAVLAVAWASDAVRDDQRAALTAVGVGVFMLHLYAYQLAFQLRQAYERVTALALACQIGFLAACAVAVFLHADGAVIALLVVARELVFVLGSRRMAARVLGYRLRASWLHPGMGELLRAAWMIGAAGVCYKVSAYAGVFILWQLPAPQALATFTAAQRLLVPMSDMAWLVAAPLIAAMGGSFARDKGHFRTQLEGHVLFLLSMSSLVAVATWFVAPLALRIVYGETYASGSASAVSTLRWLALGYLFALVSPVLVVGEMIQGNARALLFAALGALAASIAANAWATPRHGANGAAMALVASEALFFAVLAVRCVARHEVRVGGFWAPYLVPAALLAMALWLLEGLPVWQLAVACAWAPAALLVILRLPAQRACRASLAMTTKQWKRDDPMAAGNSR